MREQTHTSAGIPHAGIESLIVIQDRARLYRISSLELRITAASSCASLDIALNGHLYEIGLPIEQGCLKLRCRQRYVKSGVFTGKSNKELSRVDIGHQAR